MAGTGEIAADGKGVGASATWTFGDFWLDTQAQVTRLEAKVDSAASGKLENDATGKSLALGLEAGRRMPIARGAFLTPRPGFSWTRADLGDFTDSTRPNPTRVSVEKARSVRGRAGMTLDAPAGTGRLFGALDIERDDRGGLRLEAPDEGRGVGSAGGARRRLPALRGSRVAPYLGPPRGGRKRYGHGRRRECQHEVPGGLSRPPPGAIARWGRVAAPP